MSHTESISPKKMISLFMVVWLGHFFVDVMLGIWPVYKSLAQIDLAQAGFIAAGGAFIGEGSQLFFGALSDRGYRNYCLLFGLAMAAAALLLAKTTSISLLFLFFMVTCLGSGCFHPSAASLVSTIRPAKRNLLMSIFAAGGGLGLAFSQLIFMSTLGEGGSMIWIGSAFFLLLFLLFYFRSTPVSSSSFPASPGQSSYSRLFAFFKVPALRSLYFSQVANQSLYWAIIFILPDALQALGHPAWICFGVGHLCFILGGVVMMVPGGLLADRYSARSLMIVLSFTGMIFFYLLLSFGAYSIWVALPLLALLGASLAILNPIAVSFGVRLAPSSPGLVSAFLMGLVWCVSEAVGPGSIGLMSSFFSDYAPIKALAVLGVLFLVQIYHTLLLPKEQVGTQLV